MEAAGGCGPYCVALVMGGGCKEKRLGLKELTSAAQVEAEAPYGCLAPFDLTSDRGRGCVAAHGGAVALTVCGFELPRGTAEKATSFTKLYNFFSYQVARECCQRANHNR